MLASLSSAACLRRWYRRRDLVARSRVSSESGKRDVQPETSMQVMAYTSALSEGPRDATYMAVFAEFGLAVLGSAVAAEEMAFRALEHVLLVMSAHRSALGTTVKLRQLTMSSSVKQHPHSIPPPFPSASARAISLAFCASLSSASLPVFVSYCTCPVHHALRNSRR